MYSVPIYTDFEKKKKKKGEGEIARHLLKWTWSKFSNHCLKGLALFLFPLPTSYKNQFYGLRSGLTRLSMKTKKNLSWLN